MLVDLKPEELFAYRGSSPRPADFDEYWDRALAETEALDRNVALVPADFSCPGSECFDLWFTGAGGARIAFVHPKATGGVLLELTERK